MIRVLQWVFILFLLFFFFPARDRIASGVKEALFLVHWYARKHVKDLFKSYDVLQTPALVVDGKVVSQGKVLSKEEIKKVL